MTVSCQDMCTTVRVSQPRLALQEPQHVLNSHQHEGDVARSYQETLYYRAWSHDKHADDFKPAMILLHL